jgi:hypothetical protein
MMMPSLPVIMPAVQTALYPGSIIAEVVINLGVNASPEDVSSFEVGGAC